VDGKKVNDWEGVIDRTILSPNGDVRLSLERSGETVEKTLAVESFPDMQGGYIGIEPTLFLGNRAIIGSVEKESPADLAGIREGDRVVGIDGKPSNTGSHS
jgi:C-terminal processing protease CtpA/Prc